MKLSPERFVLRAKDCKDGKFPFPPNPVIQDEDSQFPPSPEPSQSEDSQLPPGQGDPPSPDFSQPLDSQVPTSQGEGETGQDEYDGWIRFGFIKAVKTVVHYLLSAAINNYIQDSC